jgi:two-component system cell cycle response regulator
LDRPSEPKDPCPLNEKGCPVLGELHQLKAECRRLQKLSQTDTLTGLYNFRYLMRTLETEMERTRRTGLPTGLIMIDLDHFKKVNDTYGHEAGNKTLRWSSQIFRETIRRIDAACRYGGEEFAIVLPGTRLPQAVQTAERLRTALDNSRLKLDTGEVALTASFGVDAYRGRSDLSVDDFVKRADRFLLEAKERGRNRVCYDESKVILTDTEVTEEERQALLHKHRPAK